MEHPPYNIGDSLPLEVIETILISLETHSHFLRARSVSKTWFFVVEALIERSKIPSRTPAERVRFAVFKFLSQYRDLLDPPKKDEKDQSNKTKKNKKISKNKSKKKNEIQPQPTHEPEPKETRCNIDWLRKSFETILLALPLSDKFLPGSDEKILLYVWLFAEEEDTLRRYFVSVFKPKIGCRMPLFGGYFMMIRPNKFVLELERELLAPLHPYKYNRLETDNAKQGYQPTHLDILIELSRKVATSTAQLLKLLPSKIIYTLKLLYQSSGSASMILAQLFRKFIIPSVTRTAMFGPTRKGNRNGLKPQLATHFHTVAVIITANLEGSRLREAYLDQANYLGEDLKKILIPAFEELMNGEIDMTEVKKPLAINVGGDELLSLLLNMKQPQKFAPKKK